MLRLYRLLGDHKILLAPFARAMGVTPGMLDNKLRERSVMRPDEQLRAERVLRAAGLPFSADIWTSEANFKHLFFGHEAKGMAHKPRGGMDILGGFGGTTGGHAGPPLQEGRKETAPMAMKIPSDVLERFGMARDPFLNEMESRDDVFLSKAHARVERTLFDAVSRQYFIALTAHVGAGKTTLLKRLLDKMSNDPSFHVSRLRCIEKEEANPYGIIEALLRDFSSEDSKSGSVRVNHSREARARQLVRILSGMVREKQKPVLVIDDAHALGYRVLRGIKRLYDDSELGFRRSLAVILAGQAGNFDPSQDLGKKLDNFDLREVKERCQIIELGDLGAELADYVAFKFARAGAARDGQGIVAADALKLLRESYRTPLAVNNMLSLAMIEAHDVGKSFITAEIMAEAVRKARPQRKENGE